MQKLAIFLLVAAGLISPASAADAARKPASISATGALSAERLVRLDDLLERYTSEDRIAGAVALILRDGKPVYEKAFGWSDKEAGRRMSTGTIFRIASQSKAITSAAILMLVEEGKIGLNEQVWHFIPSFSKTTVAVKDVDGIKIVPAKRAITIHDLLTHTASISYGTDSSVAAMYQAKGLGPAAGNGWYTADKDEPICETMERLGTLPFVAQPGESFVYGYNTDILGCVVEKASGMPLDRFVETRITGPIAMKDTGFFLPAAGRARLAAVYASGSNGKYVHAEEGSKGQGSYTDGPRNSYSGDALDGVRVLSARAAKLMTTNQSGVLHSATGLGFGYGFETVDRYGASGMAGVGAFGWGGAYGTVYQVDPQSRMVLVLMLQLMPNGTDIQPKFFTSVYQALID